MLFGVPQNHGYSMSLDCKMRIYNIQHYPELQTLVEEHAMGKGGLDCALSQLIFCTN